MYQQEQKTKVFLREISWKPTKSTVGFAASAPGRFGISEGSPVSRHIQVGKARSLDMFGPIFPWLPVEKILQTQNPQEKMEKCYGKQLTNWFQLSLFFANLVLTWMVSEIWVSAVLIGPLPMASCFCPIHECSQRFPWSETAIAVFFSRLISLGSLVFAVCNGWLNTSALFLHHLASKYHRPNQIVLCSLTFQIVQGWTWS